MFYIYKITNYWYDDEIMDNHYGFSHVIHEKEFTYDEFKSMCNECIKLEGGQLCDIPKYLISNYGFKYMPVQVEFEYDMEGNL